MRRKNRQGQSDEEKKVLAAISQIEKEVLLALSTLRSVSHSEELHPPKIKETEQKLFVIRRILNDLPPLAARFTDEDVRKKVEGARKKVEDRKQAKKAAAIEGSTKKGRGV